MRLFARLNHMNAQTSTPLSTCLKPSVAVIIPCHNEDNAIARVVRDFRSALPDASIFVYDNVSSDATYEVAKSAGAIVHREFRRGKGNVVRRMFADIDADVLVMVDGDDTYDASAAPTLIEHLLNNSLDMVNAARVPSSTDAYRKAHRNLAHRQMKIQCMDRQLRLDLEAVGNGWE